MYGPTPSTNVRPCFHEQIKYALFAQTLTEEHYRDSKFEDIEVALFDHVNET